MKRLFPFCFKKTSNESEVAKRPGRVESSSKHGLKITRKKPSKRVSINIPSSRSPAEDAAEVTQTEVERRKSAMGGTTKVTRKTTVQKKTSLQSDTHTPWGVVLKPIPRISRVEVAERELEEGDFKVDEVVLEGLRPEKVEIKRKKSSVSEQGAKEKRKKSKREKTAKDDASEVITEKEKEPETVEGPKRREEKPEKDAKPTAEEAKPEREAKPTKETKQENGLTKEPESGALVEPVKVKGPKDKELGTKTSKDQTPKEKDVKELKAESKTKPKNETKFEKGPLLKQEPPEEKRPEGKLQPRPEMEPKQKKTSTVEHMTIPKIAIEPSAEEPDQNQEAPKSKFEAAPDERPEPAEAEKAKPEVGKNRPRRSGLSSVNIVISDAQVRGLSHQLCGLTADSISEKVACFTRWMSQRKTKRKFSHCRVYFAPNLKPSDISSFLSLLSSNKRLKSFLVLFKDLPSKKFHNK